MTDTNDANNGGYGGWQQPHQGHPQQPHPQQPHSQQPHPQHGYQQQYGHPGYGQPVQPPMDDAATALLPPVPPMDDAAATTLLPPVPAMDDAATTLLPPVPPMHDAAATTLLPPVVVSGAMPVAPPQPQPLAQPYPQARPRHAAPAPVPTPQAQAPAQAPGLDQPTMTLKRPTGSAAPMAPTAPGAPGMTPYPAVPPQPGMPGMPAMPTAPAGVPTGPAAPSAHRTGSPIIEPGIQPALITAGVAALLAGGAALGQVALALVVALLQVLTAAGWFRLNGMWPARQGIALAALAGFTADAAVLLASEDGGIAAVVGTLGGFFLLVLVLQTFRPSDPKERFYALTVLGSATVVTALCTALLVADWVPAGVGAVALATLLAAAPLPGPKVLGPVLGLVAAVVLGLLVGAPLALGALAGVGALVGRRVASYDWPSRFVHMTAGVALPLAVAAPLIWLATGLLA
ncbi:hypothetical protein ACFXDE_37280 [Kitasatospora sp. NPDC059408]|uniref:hypothetical protein n=1 Tax=Kitasatospora sp. NPDC059408 TaxID=3346823 RepID=UPI0036AF7668